MTKLSEHLPILYILLVFLGYCNLYFFYSRFDIPVYTYITLGEIALSFVPILIPILAAAALFLLPRFLAAPDQSSSFRRSKRPASFYLSFLLTKRRRRRFRFFKRVCIGLEVVTHPGTIFMLFIAAATLFVLLQERIYEWRPLTLVVTACWLVILSRPIMSTTVNRLAMLGDKNLLAYSILVIATIFFLVFNYVDNNLSADLVLHGKPKYTVSVVTRDRVVNSDSTVVYVGMTQGYVFLRDISNGQNLIFNKDEITFFTLRRIAGR